jgi:PiT family inorganic phosphate transporter
MGHKITQLEPIDGVCAETFPAFTIFLATHLGVPVSTTHVITGAISRVGSELRFSSFRWGVTICIVGRVFTVLAAPYWAALFASCAE